MTQSIRPLAPSWESIAMHTESALACGALRSFDTVQHIVEDRGVRFLVRQVANLARKDEQSKLAAKSAADAASPWRDPFAPCEQALFIGAIGAHHYLLLNKFNVLAHHLLVVTNAFEAQETLLDMDDFAALLACLARFDALGFYNGGPVAGSSQPHKHLQLVPLPLDGQTLPVEPMIEAARGAGIYRAPGLGFTHAAAWLDPRAHDDPASVHATYRALLDAIGVSAFDVAGSAHQTAPYNLLVTRRWMLAVPRGVSHVEGIAVNALGFAGSLFVRDDAERRTVEALGPMTLLARATRTL